MVNILAIALGPHGIHYVIKTRMNSNENRIETVCKIGRHTRGKTSVFESRYCVVAYI